ncbi:hypothetical protein BGZ67_004500 [Mortierella alpina]|nr:hypothetical protein BGZ67_004500 [Mortierella alpina]
MHVLRVSGGPYLSSVPRLPRKTLAKGDSREGIDGEDHEEEEGVESETENGSEGDDERIDGGYEEEEKDDRDNESGGRMGTSGNVNMEDISNDSDSGSGAIEQNNGNGQDNNYDQTQGTNAAVVEDGIYYSDSDPEATTRDIYGDESDGDGDSESGEDDTNGGDALPDLLHDDIYHPEHPTVRQHINELFHKTLTATANPPINAPQLVDRLVRQHLPQFWRHRSQDPDLNKHKDMECRNDRPRRLAILSMCVECGYKFCKQPLYDECQRERHWLRWKRARATKRVVTGRKPSRRRKPLFGAEYFFRRQGVSSSSDPGSDSGRHDNSGLTVTEVDNILNNNRRSTRYDGNLDHIGLKEEKHDKDCLQNRASARLNIKKIYMGWGLIPGHDHVTTPPYHQVPPSSLYPSADIAATSISSLQAISTSSADPLTDAELTSILPESYCLLYPSRSLMASFCHLIPRGLVFSNNMLRKLFTYFVWHPWFDCHLQAITVRRAYSELWPLFLLRDEDEEVDDEEEAEFRKQMNAQTRARRHAAQERKKLEMQADPQAGSKRKSDDTTGSRKKTKLNDRPGTNKKGKRKNKERLVSDDDTTPPKPKIQKLRTSEELATFERSRLISLQARFTTSFNNGLGIHGIRFTSVYPSMNRRARMARQQRRGWTVSWTIPPNPAPGSVPSQPYIIDDDKDGEGSNHHDCDEKDLFAKRKVHYYIADIDQDARTTTSDILHPETLFPTLSQDAVLRLTNHPLTQPDRQDALSRLAAQISSWFRRANRRRVRRGFILPEYMEIRSPKVKPKRKTKTKTRPQPKPKRKPTSRARVKAKTKTKTKTQPKANTSTLNDITVPDSITEAQTVIVAPEESLDAGELVNYLTQPWSGALDAGRGSSSSSARRSLGVMVRRQCPRGLNARLHLLAFDTSSLPLTTVSSILQRDNHSGAFLDTFNPLTVYDADAARQSASGYHDERQLYSLMFYDMLDNPPNRSDSCSWSSEHGVDSAIPNDLMAVDLGEMDVDMSFSEVGQGTFDEHDGKGKVDEA